MYEKLGLSVNMLITIVSSSRGAYLASPPLCWAPCLNHLRLQNSISMRSHADDTLWQLDYEHHNQFLNFASDFRFLIVQPVLPRKDTQIYIFLSGQLNKLLPKKIVSHAAFLYFLFISPTTVYQSLYIFLLFQLKFTKNAPIFHGY